MLLIYSNTGEWGGVDMLIAGFAQHLESHGQEFKIVEPSGGRLRAQIPNEHFIECEEVAKLTDRVTHVFFPSISKIGDDRFPWSAFPEAKVFTWIVHPNDVFSRYFPYSGRSSNFFGYRAAVLLRLLFRTHNKILNRMVTALVENDAVATMDGATTRALNFFFPELPKSPAIVPIPSRSLDPSPARKPEKTLKIGYLGRMDAMKWSAIRPFLKYSLAPTLKMRAVELHAVAEGAYVDDLKRTCRELGIELNLHGYMPNDDARRWLAERCHVAVAMGTSALDLAGVGIPVVVLDPALTTCAPRQIKFRYIHDSIDFTLGEYRDFPLYVAGESDFIKLCESSRLLSASQDGRKHVLGKHNPDACYKLLASLILKSSLKVDDLEPVIRTLKASFRDAKRYPLRTIIGVTHG